MTPTKLPRLDLGKLEKVVERFSSLRLLVVGDVMIDEYFWGDVDRVNPEAPVPVVRVKSESTALGGAGNVLRNIAALGVNGVLCSIVGNDYAGDQVTSLVSDLGFDPNTLIRVDDRLTTQKTRVGARSQQMLRFDRETDLPIDRQLETAMLALVDSSLDKADGVILEDYGKGVLTPFLVRGLIKRAKTRGLGVSVDPKFEINMYKGASFIKPNLREVEALAGFPLKDRADLVKAVFRIRKRVGGSPVIVTRGAEGMTVFEEMEDGLDVPAARSEVFDVQGAGDTSIVALTLARLAGANLVEAAVIANAAASVVVGKLGTATASLEEIRDLLPQSVESARSVRST